jgi:putative endonuclease
MENSKTNNKKKGDKGEELASAYLEKNGYTIIERNWKFSRFELDLIAENATHLVFVEVKTRYSNVYGEPWEAVNKTKRNKICMSGDAYIRQKLSEKEPRFDIVSILQMNGGTQILHLEGAFWPMA